MLGVGFSEIIVIALVCFIAFGPQQLPAVMRKLAIYYRQLVNLKEEFSWQILSADEQERAPQSPTIPLSQENKNG